VATKLYFHAVSSGLSNLPSSEQSTLTANASVDAAGTNRSMDTFLGGTDVALALTTNATTSLQNYYFGRFVSPLIDTGTTGTTISANTWDYRFGAIEASANANFPCSGSLQPVYVNCYVWETSNGTKLGTILDGNSNSDFDETSASAVERTIAGTFAGSQVLNVTSTCVIVMEVWFRITQAAASALAVSFHYQGGAEGTDNNTNTNATAYINTPQNITFFNTKLYLRNATATIAGTLPSTEQSALTATFQADSFATNRTLSTTKGSSQASLTVTTTAINPIDYFTKMVSEKYLNQTSIRAGPWQITIAAAEDQSSTNFPVSVSGPTYINLYVWKTSAGTKTGTILDGVSLNNFVEPSLTNTETSEETGFAGAAVSGITVGDDVLVLEIWAQPTTTTASARAGTFYYDGTVETLGSGTTVSDHAAFIYTSQAIAFTASQASTGTPYSVFVTWEEA
jgi:hypothetical protein